MGDFPSLWGAQRLTQEGVLAASTNGTALTASATVNAEGAWTQIAASVSHDADGFILCVWTGAAMNALIDIGVGAAGSEVELMTDVPVSNFRASTQTSAVYCPIPLRAGVRLAGRCRGDVASGVIRVSLILVKGGFANLGPLTSLRSATFGVSTANSRGVQVDPGAAVNTKGAYSQIAASTSIPLKAIIVFMSNQRNSADSDMGILLDVSVGASGSERIILPDLRFHAGSTSDSKFPMWTGLFPVDLPSGVRLAARAAASDNNATDRLMDVAIVGFG